MPFTAATVMKRASTILQDDGAIRWTAPELHSYLNDGLREIVTLKPNANSKTVTLNLAEGTLQRLPADYTILSRIIRNLTIAHGQPNGPAGSTIIRTLAKREIMDAQMPGWQNETTMAFVKNVVHVIHDMASPRDYYVVPGNDGTGMIEAVVGAMPAPVVAPVAAPDQLIVEMYTGVVDIPDIHQNALIDYVLYRSFSKDSGIPGAANRAVAHLELFRAAVTGFAQIEAAMGVASTAMRGAAN